MNESRRNILQSILAAPAAAAVGLSAPQVVKNQAGGNTLLVFRLTKPASHKAVQTCSDNIRSALDGHGFHDIRAIVLPEYLDMTVVHHIPEGAEKCLASERSKS